MTNPTAKKIRVVFYLRVSSDDQRERQTIKTQEDILQRWLELNEARVEVVGWFKDDGISGTKSYTERDGSKKLLAAAMQGLIDQVVITRLDRLGRTTRDLLDFRDKLEDLQVSIFAVLENVEDPFEYELRAVLAADERRRFLKRSKEGMDRAAREGRYCGGIVPLGYMVEGKKPQAKLALSDKLIWGDWSEVGLVRQMYNWLAIDGWSTVRVADHLNALGVPTSYTKDERLLRDETGKRTLRTQNLWRPGRIRNLIVNTMYKGVYYYGRRSTKQREVIPSTVPALVEPEVWEAAQRTLSNNRLVTKHGDRVNLLRTLMHCTTCTLTYCAYRGARDVVWYRCGGQTNYRSRLGYRCPSRSIRADFIETLVQNDIRELFFNPDSSLVEELRTDAICTTQQAAVDAERVLIETALLALPRKKDSVLEMRINELITLDEARPKLEALRVEEQRLHERLTELNASEETDDEPLEEDLLLEVRRRAEAGFDDETWRDIIAILVSRVDVETKPQERGKKKVTITIRYRFPGVVATNPGMDSWLPQA